MRMLLPRLEAPINDNVSTEQPRSGNCDFGDQAVHMKDITSCISTAESYEMGLYECERFSEGEVTDTRKALGEIWWWADPGKNK